MTLGDVGVVISCVGHLHSNSWRANLFEVRPLIINSFFSLHFKAALMLFEVRSLLEVLGYVKCHMSNAYVDPWQMLNNFCFPL